MRPRRFPYAPAVPLGLLLLAVAACGSHADEDRAAMAQDAKGEKGTNPEAKGTPAARNLLDGATGEGADAGGACGAYLSLVTEIAAGTARTVLSGEIDADCAAGLVPVVSVTAPGRMKLPPMRCIGSGGDARTVRCLALGGDLLDGSRFTMPVTFDGGTDPDAGVRATVSFYRDVDAESLLAAPFAGGGSEGKGNGEGPERNGGGGRSTSAIDPQGPPSGIDPFRSF